MANYSRMTVVVPETIAAVVQASVADGEYASASEVVREALRDWTRKRSAERMAAEELRALIQAGIDSGPGNSADEVFARLRARFSAE